MRVLALDVGDRRIGVAVSDALGLTAQPLTIVERRSDAADLDAIAALATRYGVSLIVVGLPLTMRGTRGPQADKVERFAASLRRRALSVQLVDERLTTVQGTRVLRELGRSARSQKRAIDQVAAQLILQHYLETQRKNQPAS